MPFAAQSTHRGVVLSGNRGAPAAVSLANASIATFAGNGTYKLGDGGPAAYAGFVTPNQVALDASGNIYVADSGHNRIRKIDVVTGRISTVAGNGTAGFSGDGGPAEDAELDLPESVAFDSAGEILEHIVSQYDVMV